MAILALYVLPAIVLITGLVSTIVGVWKYYIMKRKEQTSSD